LVNFVLFGILGSFLIIFFLIFHAQMMREGIGLVTLKQINQFD